ncbi:MAG: sigma-54 dependent transcriptional regulator [Planctomycetota bacterium]
MGATVLVVDDKELMRDSVGATLRRAGFDVAAASDGQAALRAVASKRPACVITDLNMPGMTGIELLEGIRAVDEDLPVVLMTAFGTIDTAVEAMRLGAFDYITKPFEGDELVISVKRAIQHAGLLRENALLRAGGVANASSAPMPAVKLIGDSGAMRRLRDQIGAVAASRGTVLITGESGAGKEVVARAVHAMSPRAGGPFLAVNCAALSESLLESELFGHERGSFTGAEALRKGRFELADGGTLLLDEVSEVSPKIQAKLLRVLQERAFERVGSSVSIGVDVRVIATSNRDLPAEVAVGSFRQDLYYRLNVLPLDVPPLRARREDVRGLVEHFGEVLSDRDGRSAVRFDDEAMGLLSAYDWPGNVRELQNICERAVVLTAAGGKQMVDRSLIEPWLIGGRRFEGEARAAHDRGEWRLAEPKPGGFGLPSGATACATGGAELGLAPRLPGERTLEELERDEIVRTLQRFSGHRAKTARALGIGVRTLGLKLKKWKELELVEATL